MIHTARVKARVLELRKVGFPPAAIARILVREGTPVPARTIRYWCNPGAQHRDRERQRRAWARKAAKRRHERQTTARLARARLLRQEGMSYRCIAVLFRVDHDALVTEEQVRRALASGVWPRPGAYRQTCQGCGAEFMAIRPDARWCSSRCRSRPELRQQAA